MTRPIVLAFLLSLAPVGSALAEQYQDDVIVLEIPAGFEGRIEESPVPGARLVAYTKPYAEGATLLQISEYEVGDALKELPEHQLGEAADYYLTEFLGGIENRRSNFTATAPERIQLAGLPAARAQWTGEVSGKQMTGVMYCVVIGTVIVSFHTQDIEGAPPENRAAAVAALESVTARQGE